MSRYLHTLSAVLFYVLGISLFSAYILVRNAIGGDMPALILRIGDLPMLAIGMLYGGLSVYLSLRREESPSKTLALTITLPLIALFALFLILNFWPTQAVAA